MTRRHGWIIAVAAVAAVATLAVFGWQQSQPAGPANASEVVSVRVQFGVADTTGRTWDGTVAAAEGEILNLRNWRPRPGDKIDGRRGWSLATRPGPNFQRRPWEKDATAPPESYLNHPGVIIDVQATDATTLSFTTKHGAFSVKPAGIKTAIPARLLNGAVLVDRVPHAEAISDTAAQSEFTSIATSAKGDVAAAWVAWRSGANQVMVRRRDTKTWRTAEPISEGHADIYHARAAFDGKGALWVVWSAQSGDNWDLYGRRFDGSAWSAIERLTEDAQPDIHPALARDAAGSVWLVWQGFRNGKSDIFARRRDTDRWTSAERVSASPANDWTPAIAADGAGRVWVAWDTYDKGNYDVVMRSWEKGAWSTEIPVAQSPKFEAHASIACDRQNRVWAAWNESGTEWGKDTGFLVRKTGTQLYESRAIAVAVYASGRWEEPAAGVDAALSDLNGFKDLPQLVADSEHRVWLFFRHRFLRIRDVPFTAPAHRAAWEIYGTSYEGGRWRAPVAIPFSQGRTEMQGAFAPDPRGGLWAAWSTDHRDFEDFLFGRAEVHAGKIPAMPTPALTRLRPRVQPALTANRIHENEPEDLKRIRAYTIASEGKTYRIYRGDTHRHTEFSMDGNFDGSLLEAYRYAIDAAELDFLGVSEHNGLGGPDTEYVNFLLQQRVAVFQLAGTFAPLYVYERSVVYPNGHRNIIFSTRGNPTFPIPASEATGATGAQALYQYLKKHRGIAISHTSATNMGTDWRDNDPEVEPLVEIFQGDRVSAEYEGAPKAAWRGSPASAIGGFRPAGYVWNAWAKGYKLGVQVSSDHLSTHLSYACTIAEEFTRDGLVDAMRKRHSYGATDNIILDYRLQSGGREHLQGDIVQAPGEFRLVVKVIGTQPIRQIDVIKNNTFIHTRQPLEREVTFTFSDSQPSAGESYYYVRVIQVDEQIAWSSPIWVRR